MIIDDHSFWLYLKKNGYDMPEKVVAAFQDKVFLESADGNAFLSAFKKSFDNYAKYLEVPLADYQSNQ